ncbi:helicase-associated domain-containing protein [Serinibacter arcticus]|nr:helicase-associated domain-containing protein [Serinibacter arcticus]
MATPPPNPPQGSTGSPTPADLTDDALAALLQARPDLASPLPGSFTALAARAATVRSVQLAVAGLDTPHLAALDAVVALTSPTLAPMATAPVTTAAVAAATGLEDAAVPLTGLVGLALLVAVAPSPAAPDGAWLPGAGVAAARPRPAGLAIAVEPVAGSTAAVAATEGLTPPARRILDALTWGPPVGTFGAPAEPAPVGSAGTAGDASDAPTAGGVALAVEELLERSLVRRTADGGIVLPAATAIELRGGRTHRDLTAVPPTAPAAVVTPETVAAESARAALELHRHLADLTETWAVHPAGALRSGGVGVREIRRTGTAIKADERTTVLLVELAAAAAEIGQAHDDDGALWAPTRTHDGDAPTLRWARLAHVWLHSERAFALVGTRADDGALRAVLEPGLERGWAARLRRRVLEALAAWPTGSAPDLAAVRGHLDWHTPVSPPPDWAVAAVLAEADLIGVVAAGALSRSGAALLAGEDVPALAATLEADLPPAVEEILLQADLTAIVPGRPSRAIEELLERATDVESRGSGVTARFTTASLSRAIEAGLTASDVLATLAALSRTPVPQALEYAIRDAERRHGGLRAGPASSYLRSDDAALLTALVADSDLALRLLAPTVAISQLPAGRLALALRGSGRAVLIEGPDGVVVATAEESETLAAPPRRARVVTTATAELDDLLAAVRRLREAEKVGARGGGAGDPADGVALLRTAVRDAAHVWVTIVGPSGAADRRRLAPMRVQGGHVIARDLERGSDLTIALHRIADVERI